MTPLQPLIAHALPDVVRLRRHLHEHPEPAFEEFETAARVTEILRALQGFEVTTGVGGTGVVAVLDGEKSGPCVALRADMDCLRIMEETGLPYASRKPGLMHACGHDGHTAALVGAAMVLARVREELAGPIKFVFQPAEEGGAGAERMIRDGVLDGPRVEAIFGFHNNPAADLEAGDIAFRPGGFMGGGFDFQIAVSGRGGHASAPHTAVDPIFIGAQIVNALQSMVSRSANPIESLVVTVASFKAGTANNIIPDRAHLAGTARSLQPSLVEAARERLPVLVAAIAAAHSGEATTTITPGYPVVENDARAAAFVAAVATKATHVRSVHADLPPLLASEDFSFYQQQRPGCFFFIGSRPAGSPEVPGWHQSRFDFNDDILPVAIEMHAELGRRFAHEWDQV